MSALTRETLIERLSAPLDQRLVVTPLLLADQVQATSIDLRLGSEFLLLSRFATSSQGSDDAHDEPKQDFVRHRLEFGTALYVHPGQFVYAATLEFVRLPSNLMAYVVGKSSLGRSGLEIATAIKIDPGFAGCITLELYSIGEVPLKLFPGMRVCQIVLHTTHGSAHGLTEGLDVWAERPLLWSRTGREWSGVDWIGGTLIDSLLPGRPTPWR